MLTEIPTAAEFHSTGLNQIYLAWQIAMQALHDFEEAQQLASELDENDTAAAAAAYWSKSQPVLANAFGLVQQAMEMALKGRISAVSPYLLIARDPKDWPAGVDTRAIPFSDFRTLDAADLVKVHNTFAAAPLNDAFRGFWEDVRRERNRLIHSVSAKTFDPALLIRTVLVAVEALFSDIAWPQRLLAMEADGKYAAYGLGKEHDHNVVMGQIDIAIRYLKPAEDKRFFGFDPKRRAYVCPLCWGRADRDLQADFPALAQLISRQPGETMLHCVVCGETTKVERNDCTNQRCVGSVIHENSCLICLCSQDDPTDFPSGLQDENLGIDREYRFSFQRKFSSTGDYCRFPDDESAIEHARCAMEASYLRDWRLVTVVHHGTRMNQGVLGTWIREESGLVWRPRFEPPLSFLANEEIGSESTASAVKP